MSYVDAVRRRIEAIKGLKVVRTADPKVQAIVHSKAYQARWYGHPAGSKEHVSTILRDGQWKGGRCFLIGGGPSLEGFDFEILRGEHVIAVNRAYEDAPFADILFSMDRRYYRWIIGGAIGTEAKRKYDEFKGVKIWLDTQNMTFDGVYYIQLSGKIGLSRHLKDGLFSGNNSGFGALNLAFILGASPIYLLGYDMKHKKIDGRPPDRWKSHYHGGYPTRQSARTVENFIQNFHSVAKDFVRAGVRVINLNPDSALTCFPRQSREEFFANWKAAGNE